MHPCLWLLLLVSCQSTLGVITQQLTDSWRCSCLGLQAGTWAPAEGSNSISRTLLQPSLGLQQVDLAVLHAATGEGNLQAAAGCAGPANTPLLMLKGRPGDLCSLLQSHQDHDVAASKQLATGDAAGTVPARACSAVCWRLQEAASTSFISKGRSNGRLQMNPMSWVPSPEGE